LIIKLELSADQAMRQIEFRDFVNKHIVPYAQHHDTNEIIHSEVIRKIRDSGYLASMLPKKYNGMEFDQITIGILNEEFGRGCASTRSILTVHGMVSLAILRWGTEQQKNEWLPKLANGEVLGSFALTEPNAGSDANSMETTAVVHNEGYVISGKKKWITMGQISNVFLLFAKCDGKPTAFLIEKDREGLEVKPMCGLLGARGSMLAELSLNNCYVPKQNLLGQVGIGFSHIALTCLDYGRYTIASGCVGMAQACLEASIQYSGSRLQFGKPIREHQLIQKMITEMSVQVKAARLLCYKAGYLREILDPDSIVETWSAKYYASLIATKIASDAVQIHGANGCHRDYPVERYYRDAKINEIIEGTTQMHELLIANQESANIQRTLLETK